VEREKVIWRNPKEKAEKKKQERKGNEMKQPQSVGKVTKWENDERFHIAESSNLRRDIKSNGAFV
jgi:hypothetical protein